jgi:ubiquinone biosynthesis protein
MVPDTFQIDPQELAAVVPDCYAEFRPIVADGLTFFLRHLSPSRLAEILRSQADLPADAELPRRLVLFLHACPALHKMGQVVARNRHLDPELRRHLQELESLEPHTPPEQWRGILARELAPAAEEYRIRVDDSALAEASVAVVVPFTWTDPAAGADAPRREGVAKLLKPGVVDRLDEDLDILGRLAAYLDERWSAYDLPPLDYGDVFNDVAELLASEILVRQEQEHLHLAGRQFAGQSDVQVPGLLPFCTGVVTTMDRVYGTRVADPGAMSRWLRPVLFHTTVRALLSQVLFSRDESVLFHGDPHAGNLLATQDGRLAILDWSLAGRLTNDDRVRMSQIMAGGLARDAARVAGAVAGLARDGTCGDLICRHVATALGESRRNNLPGPNWAVGLLDALAGAGVRFPPRLLLFRKAFLTLQGVLSDVYAAGSLEAALTVEALVHLTWEWPTRLLKPPDDRDYATHLSSSDLAQMALAYARQFCPQAAPGY